MPDCSTAPESAWFTVVEPHGHDLTRRRAQEAVAAARRRDGEVAARQLWEAVQRWIRGGGR